MAAPTKTPRMTRLTNPPKVGNAGAGAYVPPPPKILAEQDSAMKAHPSTTLKVAEAHRLAERAAGQNHATMMTALGVAKAAQLAASVTAKKTGASDPVIPDSDAGVFLDVKFRDSLLEAVKAAVATFRAQAFFEDITIFSVTAVGSAGCLVGPHIEPLIKAANPVADLSGPKSEIRDAVAEGVGASFDAWRGAVTVPGLLWYPTFAAFPGPQAPPTPNVPCSLSACVSAKAPEITSKFKLEPSIVNALPDALKIQPVKAFCGNVALCLSAAFLTWLISQQVSTVMGKGPVPSFAPPAVPAGPVISGSVVSAPGCLFFGGTFPVVKLPL